MSEDGWIDLEGVGRHPEEGIEVLVWGRGKSGVLAREVAVFERRRGHTVIFHNWHTSWGKMDQVTHWQPLPAPPVLERKKTADADDAENQN